jgi:hypothetical protein
MSENLKSAEERWTERVGGSVAHLSLPKTRSARVLDHLTRSR